MRIALLAAIGGCLLAQLGASQTNRQFIEIQKDIASINEKISLIVWLGSGIGVITLGVAGKLFFDPKSAAQSTPALADYRMLVMLEDLRRDQDRLQEAFRRSEESRKSEGTAQPDAKIQTPA